MTHPVDMPRLIAEFKAQTTLTQLSIGDVLSMLQKAVLNLVGQATTGIFSFDPILVEQTIRGYVEQFYVAVIKPLEIASLPGGAISEALLHGLFSSAASAMIHAAVQLVFRTQVAKTVTGDSVEAASIADVMLQVGQPG